MSRPKFKLGDRVRKIKGSQWNGIICGTYSTELTPEGYCVESEYEKGSVQIYPAAALEACGYLSGSIYRKPEGYDIKMDKYGRDLEDFCMKCGVKFELDYSDEDKYGDELRPIRGYCRKHYKTSNNHPYPGI